MIRIGVIGYGNWGPNLVRNFTELADAKVAIVCDHHPERLAQLELRHPGMKSTLDQRVVFDDPSLDAVAIATPISTHFELAMAALQAGKHVLVEKPLAETVEQARRLTDEAARRNRVLIVDHTLVYSGAVGKMAELIRAGELGRILYFDSTRINLGLFRDVNVIADLGVHDFAMLDHLVDERPVAVSASGAAHLPGVPENLANVTFFYDSGTIAHVGLSWISPVRFRQVLVGGDRKMVVYNELDAEQPIRIHDKGVQLHRDAHQTAPAGGAPPANDAPSASRKPSWRIDYRNGDMWAPRVDTGGPLRVLCQHFVDCIANGHTPITDGRMGTRMVEMIDAATRSMHGRGQPITLDHTGTRE